MRYLRATRNFPDIQRVILGRIQEQLERRGLLGAVIKV